MASACFLEGADQGGPEGRAETSRGDLHQGGRARPRRRLGQPGPRLSAGRAIPDALAALEKAANHKEPAAPWVINWLTGQINASNGMLDDAIASFESVLATKVPARKFDFSTDYRVINDLGCRALRPGAHRAAGHEPGAARLSPEGDRRLPAHARDRFRKRRRPLGTGPGV